MSRLPQSPTGRQAAVKLLCDLGAKIVLCQLEGKMPIESMTRWQTLPAIPARDAIRHNGRLGIEPASLGCAVVDVDGASADLCGVMQVSICDWMGVDPLIVGPSLSGATTGKRHLWFGIDLADEAPLGRKPSGKRGPYLSAPTDMRWIPDEAGSEFDIRFRHGYVIVDPYLEKLAAALREGKPTIGPKWASLIPHGLRHRRKGKGRSANETAQLPVATSPANEDAYEQGNTAYLARAVLPPTSDRRGQYETANQLGFKAGTEWHFNPRLYEQAKDWLRSNGLVNERWETFEKAFEDGKDLPATAPLFPSAGPKLPPISAYEQDAERYGGTVLREFELAERYVGRREGALCFDVETKRWFEFRSGWSRPVAGAVTSAVRRFVREANPAKTDPKSLKAYDREPLGRRVTTMTAELTAIRASEVFDQNDLLVGLRGGKVYDVRTGETRAARLGDRVSIETAVEPEQGETSKFDKFLEETFGGDTATIKYLLRFLGYCLTGSTSEHRMLFFQGPPATGKSALLELIRLIFGGLARAVPARTFLESRADEHPTVVANLQGHRLVYFAETGEGKRLDEARMSEVIAGDKIAARVMRGDYFEFVPRCKLIMSSNFRPSMSGGDSGIYRRLRLILFSREVPEKDRIEGLAQRIFDAEGPSILARLLAEATAWHKERERSGRSGLLPESPAIDRETAGYFAEADPIPEFVETCLDFGADYKVTRKQMYAAYREWATGEGLQRIITQTTLTRKLLRVLKSRGVTDFRSGSVKGFRGVRLLPREDDAEQAEMVI